ncbi:MULTISPECIES: hypothetical protein [unclassified Rhizobium]|uniref:hypothetical protein n=1 Tax=unclassified Rhizobium TaxID=2613769 RepID=UPI001ADA0C3D|nr:MULTISPECIES: hypothetical protein [unclassified Rhizobium]MBO9125494.1 hypothetical protein [Rhizobium sp. 16-488-2b]MBO9176079.1 hypothetical protein [Rhizobium sp. 16-488-2a]
MQHSSDGDTPAPVDQATWARTNGRKPDLADHEFIFVRGVGETREEVEAHRDGYGQSVASVEDWSDTIEYRLKRPLPAPTHNAAGETKRVSVAYAYCCSGSTKYCDCVNPNHGTVLMGENEPGDDYIVVDAPAAPAERGDMGRALADALNERQRQVDAEGWISQHDDQYRNDELPRAAMCYLLGNPGNWPWSRNWWKPTDRRRDLIKAAALIIAEIERLDRASSTSATGGAA